MDQQHSSNAVEDECLDEPSIKVMIEVDQEPSHPRRDWDCASKLFVRNNDGFGDKDAANPYCEIVTHTLDGLSLSDDQFYESIDILKEIQETSATPGRVNWLKQAITYLENAGEEIGAGLDPNIAVILPVDIYEHSGATIRVTSDFDSPSGWIYCTKETLEAEFGGDTGCAEACLRSEVERYDHFLRGNVWNFRVERDGEEIESCGGLFGDELDETGMLDCVDAQYHDAIRAAWEGRFG